MTLEEALRRTREVAAQVTAPLAPQIDRDAMWPSDSFRALLAAGLGGLVVPRKLGGLELGLAGLARVSEELGRSCPSTAISFGMHHVASAVISAKPTTEQAAEIVSKIVRGQHIATLALSEPGTGSHFYLPQTELLQGADGDLLLRGEKSFVTNGGHADSYVVSAVAAGEDALPGEFSCVLVDKDASNLSWGSPWQGLGMRGNDARNLQLRDVVIPRSRVLGEQGDQIWYVFNVVAPYFLVAMAGTYLGIASSALRAAQHHLSSRQYAHDGSTLAHQPVLQHRIGTLWAKVARTRALVYYAADAGDAGDADALMALCSAKAEVADCAVDVVNDAMTLMGGKGYAADSPLHRMLRDARAAHVMAPTTDVLRTWTGRAFLDIPLLSD